MNTNLTDITVVLDRSGSMMPLRRSTIEGYNRFLREQQATPGDCLLSLNQFSDGLQRLRVAESIHTVAKLSRETYVPDGNTGLLDAVGWTIEETGARLAKLPEHQRPAKVVLVIITDGEENASRTYTWSRIREMIRHQEERYAWSFIFLGSDLRAVESAVSKMGIAACNVMFTAANDTGTAETYTAVASNIRKARMSATPEEARKAYAFTADQIAAQDAARNEP